MHTGTIAGMHARVQPIFVLKIHRIIAGTPVPRYPGTQVPVHVQMCTSYLLELLTYRYKGMHTGGMYVSVYYDSFETHNSLVH